MKRSELKKLNDGKSAKEVESAIIAAGFAPFEEGDIEALTLMTIFKARERHTARKKKDGVYIKLQSFASPEGAEEYEFIALGTERKRERRGEDGKKFEPLACGLFCRKIGQ